MTAEREMTLHEWVGKLPEIHLARKELVAMQERLAALEKGYECYCPCCREKLHVSPTSIRAAGYLKEKGNEGARFN